MFEKFTETARKVIFHARYEASKFGSEHIETEHLLLGILRTDGFLALRLLKTPDKVESIREQIEKQFPRREKISTSVDLPVSQQCKLVLTYAVEEAERLNDEHIATGHLLLALLRVEDCGASRIMSEHGLTSSQVEQALLPGANPPSVGPVPVLPLPPNSRDLTALARSGKLNPLTGREHELDRIVQILSRRARNNPVLIGEPGVGKNALIEGLAQRIADGAAPRFLADRPILAIDAASLLSRPGVRLPAFPERPDAILYVQGLFDLAAKGTDWSVLESVRVLEPRLSQGVQCIATGTPFGLRMTTERVESLARHFEVVPVLPPTEEEAIRMVAGVKEQYEKFHGVAIANEAIETAVAASRWFLRHRRLPDRAIDLIDDAAACVRLRHEMKRSTTTVVSPEDVIEAVAMRARVPVSAVESLLRFKTIEPLESVTRELAAQFPIGGLEWADALTAWLAGCSPTDAESLALAIRSAKLRLTQQ